MSAPATTSAEKEEKEEKLDGPVKESKHAKKFDRQMRLWGKHGQQGLEMANICVIGAGPTGSEALKNLVLPNCGAGRAEEGKTSFTIVDGGKVGQYDLGNNFFVTKEDLNKSRAEAVCKWLAEMNSAVKGAAVCEDVEKVLAGCGDKESKFFQFFNDFTFVVATQLYGKVLQDLAAHLWQLDIPLIHCRSNGLVGECRLQIREHTIIESHPTNDRTDLYIHEKQLKRFPEMDKYLKAFDLMQKEDLDGDDTRIHCHIPCIAIIAQFAVKNGLPKTYDEKRKWKDEIQKSGKYDDQSENYKEAKKYAPKAYMDPQVPPDVQRVLSDPAGEKLDKKSSAFWVLVRALRDFMENEGQGLLPVSESIPDMHSLPEYYQKVKQIYADKAADDRKLIKAYAMKRLKETDVKEISEELITRFVKNCRSLRVVRTRAMAEEYSKPNVEAIQEAMDEIDMAALMAMENPDYVGPPPLPKVVYWNIGLKACDVFVDTHKRVPGSAKEGWEKDNDLLKEIANKIYADLKRDSEPSVCEELVRYGGSEVHNTAALIGGVASQVALKLMTKQYVPFKQTFTYCGINCTAGTFKF